MIVNELMSKFWNNELTNEDLVKQKVSIEEVQEAINYSIKNKDCITLENALFLAHTFQLFNNREKMYSILIEHNWHREHEDITRLFQLIFNNEKENIEVLVRALENTPFYLDSEDFKYPYIRKIIYAIGAQPEPYNIEALDKLAKQTNDEHIKQLALHQIEKRKRLGRWEFERNSKNAEL